MRPHRRQPTRFPRPWDSPGKNTGVGCHFLLQCMKVKVKVKSLGRVRLLATPWAAAYQAPPSMGFSRQEYWSGVPLPSLMNILVHAFSLQPSASHKMYEVENDCFKSNLEKANVLCLSNSPFHSLNAVCPPSAWHQVTGFGHRRQTS